MKSAGAFKKGKKHSEITSQKGKTKQNKKQYSSTQTHIKQYKKDCERVWGVGGHMGSGGYGM
ncbi:MAG: hypothetical protein PHW56_02720 [Methanosarcinaceae archaeon]|nr:hypothetical protein [Methanosarcinaceae archaeon]